jgi:hypothetical protein
VVFYGRELAGIAKASGTCLPAPNTALGRAH